MIEKQLFQFCGNTKKYIKLAVVVNCIKLLANISFSLLLAYLLSNILEGNKDVPYPMILGGMAVLILIRQTYILEVSKRNQQVVSEVKHNLRKEVYGKVLRLGNTYQETLTTQEIVHLGVEGVEQLENYYGAYLTQFYYCFTSAIILFGVVAPFNFGAAFVMFVLTPIIPLSLQMMMKVIKKVQSNYWESYADVGNLFLDSIQGLTTLKIFGADKKRGDDMDNISERFRVYTMKLLASQLNSMAVIDWFAYGGAAAGIIIAINQYAKGNVSLYGVIVIILLAAEFFVPMKVLTSLFHVAMTGVTASDRMLEFMKKEEPQRDGNKILENDPYIEVKHLTHVYKDGTKALDNISLNINPGKMTAIVGPSGCGKSTLANILSGQFQTERNHIYLNAVEFYQYAAEEVTTKITRITHDGHLFIGTVKDNLLMGNESATEEQMIKSLEKVSMWDYLKTQDGLDTKVLSGGKNLSGGQAQRISLARALLHNSQIYIFDEATSNIDVESEEIILKVINEIAKKNTVVYISHRLQSIKNADHIYVMEKGRIIQEGTHEQLMDNKGLYKNLFTEQEALETYRMKFLSKKEEV